MKIILCLFAIILLPGCNSPAHYKIKPATSVVSRLSKTSKVFVGILPNLKNAPNQSVAMALAARCRHHFANVVIGTSSVDETRIQEDAIQSGADLLFLARVIFYEDTWSANPDRFELFVLTINLATKAQANAGSILITRPWWTLGNYSPSEFTEVASEMYLRYLTGDLTKLEGSTSFKHLPK